MSRAESLGLSVASINTVTMEPGSNFPVLVLPGADLERAYGSVQRCGTVSLSAASNGSVIRWREAATCLPAAVASEPPENQ